MTNGTNVKHLKNEELGTASILRLIITYSAPSVVATIVNALYNIADRHFIGKYASEDALAGLTISFPIILFIVSIAALIAIGGSTLITIKMGSNKLDEANEVHGNLITLMFLTTIVTLAAGYPSIEKLFSLFNADKKIVDEGVKYMNIILIGFFFQLVSFTFANLMRAEGRPGFAMFALVFSAIFNVILDYIFIKEFGWGTKGAAWATVIAEFGGFAILTGYFLSGKSILKIYKKNFLIKMHNIKMIFKIGLSAFFSNLGASLAIGMFSATMIKYGGSSAVTALGAVATLDTMAFLPIIGMQQGVQPIMAYNYGAKNIARVNTTLYYSVAIGVALTFLITITLYMFPSFFLSLFLDKSSETMAIAENGLRIFIVGLPFVPLTLIGTAYLQSTVKAGKAFILSMCRQIIFVIPLLYILPHFWGLNGVWFVMPLSDILTSMMAILLIVPILLIIKKQISGGNNG